MSTHSTTVRRFERNTQGRDLIIGDVHGHFTKLRAALDAVAFDPAGGDRIFSVGDLVDRGPESAQALEWLAQPWFFAVRGNHEDMAIAYDDGVMDGRLYAANGGAWNLDATSAETAAIAATFRMLPIAMELQTAAGTVGIVHADCPCRSWPEFVAELEGPTGQGDYERQHVIEMAIWNRARIEEGVTDAIEGVHAVVVGHTPVERVTSLGNVHYIDTGGWLPVHQDGHFTVLNAETLQPERGRVAANDGAVLWEAAG
ncbi:metallophosphoesterase [Xenophilus sp. Marseille-Q4582]|uniref:metallophosphoesterase n=1 Tax=Xenophilus sp. Marseille-Q4582 TaxID=2866600 RepID=UPI001CE3E83D|nr:metallophosphoesterase [Xenophilus sp. Marseille-Q4582]